MNNLKTHILPVSLDRPPSSGPWVSIEGHGGRGILQPCWSGGRESLSVGVVTRRHKSGEDVNV